MNVTTLTPLNQQHPILAFGDSLTFGYGAPPEQSYPFLLSHLINQQIINAGINGELSKDGLLRLELLLDKHAPQLLLLCHGANDILQNACRTTMMNNIDNMVKMAHKRGIDVVLIAVPDVNDQLSNVVEYQQIATQNNILLADNLLAELLKQPALHSDIIHPNNLGYGFIAESIATLLKANGAL